MSVQYLIGAILLAILVIAIIVIAAINKNNKSLPVRAKALLTQRELQAFHHLQALLPHLHIAPQVAMGAIVEQEPRLDRSDAFKVRNRFDRKIVDFVAFEPITGKIAFLIEIDDSSHNTARDAERDAITESAGYITIRHPARAKVTHAAIAATLRPYLPNAAA